VIEALAYLQQLLSLPAFTVDGLAVTRLELLGFTLALAMVMCNIRVNTWAWPLAISSSLLYALLFWQSQLYGEASLQLFFVAMAAWGWVQWLRGRQPSGQGLKVAALSTRQRIDLALVWLLLWPVLTLLLKQMTDTDVPRWDAFVTAGSLIGTWLLGKKKIENWPVWVVVNALSIGLFAYKGLWLTVLLYAVLIAMAVWGWHSWRTLMHPTVMKAS
jgi:nicotinamide mononucleotide transporter